MWREIFLYLSLTFFFLTFFFLDGKVNLGKRLVLSVNFDLDPFKLDVCDALVGCVVGSFPTSYMGLPIGNPLRNMSFLDMVV